MKGTTLSTLLAVINHKERQDSKFITTSIRIKWQLARLINAVSNYDWKYKILRHIIWWNNSLYLGDIFHKSHAGSHWLNRYFILRLLSCIELKFHTRNLNYGDSLPSIRFRIMFFNRLKLHFTILIGKSACHHQNIAGQSRGQLVWLITKRSVVRIYLPQQR